MRWILILLAVAGCAPLHQPQEFIPECEERPATIRARALGEEQHREELAMCTRISARIANFSVNRRNQEARAMGVAIVLGAASDALAEHNFYVYDVPRAMRYLEGTRR